MESDGRRSIPAIAGQLHTRCGSSPDFAQRSSADMLFARCFSSPSFQSVSLASLRIPGSRPSATPVIFLHGLFGNKNNWKSVARRVSAASGRTTFSVDLRNHGDSEHSDAESSVTAAMAVDVKEFLRREGLPRSILVGHSLGGRVALQFAFLYPGLVEKVIAVDVSPLPLPSSMNSFSSYIEAMEKVVKEVSAAGGLAVARKAADQHLSGVIQEKFIRDFLIMNLVRSPDGELMWKFNLKAIRELVAGRRFREVSFSPDKPCDCEAVFIYGQKSDFVLESDHSEIQKLFPESKFFCFPDAGHYLHVEKQEEFLRLLLSQL